MVFFLSLEERKCCLMTFPYRDIFEETRWVKEYGIHLIASNELTIESEVKIHIANL